MRNVECRMRNVAMRRRALPQFSIHHSAFIILLFLTLFVLPSHRLMAANIYDIFYHSPYTVEPDTTKVIYPIPVNTGNPLQDLNNQSPLYLRDPDNFETEIIYDPLTGQYTFKRRIGQFYCDTPTTLTQDE